MAADDRARHLVATAKALKNDRSTFEDHWQDIADVFRPQAFPFKGEAPRPGEKRTSKMYDAAPPLALERFAAVLEALLSPRNQVWSKLVTTDDELQDDVEVQRYLDSVNRVLFRVRYRPASNMASQLAESYLNLGSFGTQALFVGDDVGNAVTYRSCGLHNILIAEDAFGRVNQVFRHYQFTAQQAMQAFVGKREGAARDAAWAKMPAPVKVAYETKANIKFPFLHAVVPREQVDARRLDYRGMPLASFDLFMGDSSIVDEGGYRVMPYCVSRYTKNSEEIYGRSPAMLVLPGVNMLNRMKKATVRGAEQQVDPPLMTMDDAMAPFNLESGAMNYGTLNEQGEPTVRAFDHKADVRLGIELMQLERGDVRDAFLLDVFQVMMQSPQLNMLQLMEIAKEKAALLGPMMGRQQTELFGPMTERELDILTQAGMLPPMPQALINAGAEVTIEYLSPMSLAQRAETGVSIMRTLEAVIPLTQTEEGKGALRVFNIEETVRELAQINNYPAKAMRSKEEVKALDEDAANAEQMAQLVAAAPQVTQSMKSMAEAQSMLQPGSLQ